MKRAVILSVVLLFAASALAQIRGVPASVTSITPNNPTPGVGASVTSLGPNGFGVSRSTTVSNGWNQVSQFGNAPFLPPTTFTCSGMACAPTTMPSVNSGHRHHHRPHFPIGAFGGYGGYVYTPVYPVYPVYTMDYGTGSYAEPEAYEPIPEPEAPAPTIFENRPTTRPYARDEARYDQPPAEQPQAPKHADLGVGAEETTTLVFRDGHQLDIHNYAIVAGSIFNFDGTGPFKTPLSELDIPATIKLNEDRGVIFKVPATT